MYVKCFYTDAARSASEYITYDKLPFVEFYCWRNSTLFEVAVLFMYKHAPAATCKMFRFNAIMATVGARFEKLLELESIPIGEIDLSRPKVKDGFHFIGVQLMTGAFLEVIFS